mmetsp:Transcript_647/g.3019  ORF Transcript_647/g.3019 Transcript_647/m.3019 type:complete len:782 (+) Transcript_647:98-2443(+)
MARLRREEVAAARRDVLSTVVPDGAEDSLDALQHAGERLEADAAALRRGILLAAQRALASNREHRRDPSHAEEAKTVAALADLAPPSTERIDADEDEHMGFGRTAFPGRETRRVDADIARRAATLEEQSNRFRSLASAATAAEAFARAETSMREGEAALARGEHERASTALGDVRAALTNGTLDAPSDAAGTHLKPNPESSFGDLRARDRARSLTSAADSLHDAIQTDLTARLERSFAVDKDTGSVGSDPTAFAAAWLHLSNVLKDADDGSIDASTASVACEWANAWALRAGTERDARVLAEGLERSIGNVRDAWVRLPEGSRRFVAKTFGKTAWPTIAAAIVTRWFSTNDADDNKLDEECVNALVGAEGAAQALGLVPPPPNVGPIESAAFERERRERNSIRARVLSAARDVIVADIHGRRTMRVIPSDEERADWAPGIGGAGLGFGDEDSACEVSEADGVEFLQAGGRTVSAAAHELAAHVSRTLVQGVTEGDGTASSSSSSSAATDALDLFRALRDPENCPDVPSPASVCVYANDCAYLAARWCAACVTYNASRMTGTDAAARRSVSIAAAVSPLTGSGDRAIRALVARTRAEIFHALDDSNNFRDLGEDGAVKEATNAVRRARHLMGRVVAALSRLLPKRTGARLARELLGAYAVKVTKDALSLSDVSVDESECLKKLLTEAFDPCGLLVVSAGGGRSDADAEAAALIEGLEGHEWMKGSALPSMLDANMTDLLEWWESGRLPALGFGADEVGGFVRANFEASENRSAVLDRLLSGE